MGDKERQGRPKQIMPAQEEKKKSKSSGVTVYAVLVVLAAIAMYKGSFVLEPKFRADFWAWLPSKEAFLEELHKPVVQPKPSDPRLLGEEGKQYYGEPELLKVYSAWEWCAWTRESWWIPLTTCTVYIIGIPVLRNVMAKREKILAEYLVTAWNLSLSIFSAIGLFYTLPALVAKVSSDSFYGSVCGPAFEYGHGMPGFFVMCFIYSKIAEVVDTFFLLIRKSPVIFLHWYHHATVMLYCWHAFAMHTGYAGLWFATMNYFVHALMYFYYAMMQASNRTRKIAAPYAIILTTLQITQMVMGMFVLAKSVLYQIDGQNCYLNRSNQILGLLMYLSYFVLFAKLFLEYYVFGGKEKKAAERAAAEAKKLKAQQEGAKINGSAPASSAAPGSLHTGCMIPTASS